MSHNSAVLLYNPKFPHNVGAAIRACSIFGADLMRWTPQRVEDPKSEAGGRIPREERMREYARVDWSTMPQMGRCVDQTLAQMSPSLGSDPEDDPIVPVCVEVLDSSESLVDFIHPENALYVFGPEDGEVPKGIRNACHRFVSVPSRSCMNLGAAVNVVLYDRCAKMGFPR
jgi:tRNA(Leu) C34 or U34 (ribose-2'-O)-methylase TrmL